MNTPTSRKTESRARLRPAPGDAVVVLAVLLLAGALFFSFFSQKDSDSDLICTVSQNGQVLDEITLSVGAPDEVRTYGDYVLELNHNFVRLQSAPCANQDCVHTGWIYRNGQSIVCLPGRFVVELRASDGSDPGFDTVVK